VEKEKYVGGGGRSRDNPSVCAHSAGCLRQASGVWLCTSRKGLASAYGPFPTLGFHKCFQQNRPQGLSHILTTMLDACSSFQMFPAELNAPHHSTRGLQCAHFSASALTSSAADGSLATELPAESELQNCSPRTELEAKSCCDGGQSVSLPWCQTPATNLFLLFFF
jgi:hypothetical protein